MPQQIFTLPDSHLGVTQNKYYLKTSNLSSTALYGENDTPYGETVQRWYAEITGPKKDELDSQDWEGFIAGLRGRSGLIRMPDAFRLEPAYNKRQRLAGLVTGEPFSDDTFFTDGTGFISGLLPPFVTVDESAVEGATSLVWRSLPASVEKVISRGDRFEVRPGGKATDYGNYYMAREYTRSDSNGKARITFEPGLRADIAAGDMIVLKRPMTVFRLATDDNGIMTRTLPNHGSAGLSLVENLVRP